MKVAGTGILVLVLVLLGPCVSKPALSQQIAQAPLPPVRYTAWAGDEGPSEQAAEAEVGKEEEEGDLDFLNKDLSEISHTQVTSPTLSSEINTVSRTTQPLARTPAAVYVVTNEMIKRCGARNIPEVLRTVPGVNVARVNASTWAISIRGFRDRFANKLLVQIDGVAIYNPLNAGVYWERDHVMLEDVDRIEVIRGPGGVFWGNNAVNGIINIVTKSSQNTNGIYADVGGGNEHRQFSDVRVGGRTGELNWRVYGMNVDDDHGIAPPGNRAVDSFHFGQGGFRTDWTPTHHDTITLQSDLADNYVGRMGYVAPTEAYTGPRYIDMRTLIRWTRTIDEDTDWAVQLYYNNQYGKEPQRTADETRNVSTFDLDFQYHMRRGRHDILWGFGYRNSDELFILDRPYIQANFADSEQIPSYFVQDTITFVPDRFYATFGCRFDHNSVTDFEYQPTAKVAWTPDERTSIWGAISRTVRTPSLMERSVMTPGAEDALTYEVGIRRQPKDPLFWEFTVFFNRYDNIIGEMGTFVHANTGKADTYGFEYNATYEMNPRWHLTGSYSFFIECLRFQPGYTAAFPEGSTPRNQFYVQSGWDLWENVTLDVMFRYVDSLACGVEHYFVGDIRLAWRPRTNLEFAVVGQNLLDGGHYEFIDTGSAYPTEVEPGVYGMVSWRY